MSNCFFFDSDTPSACGGVVHSDINGDGTKEKVGYAIISSSSSGGVSVTSSDTTKASNLVARFAPLETSKNTNPLCPDPQFDIDTAWRPTNSSSTFRKTFQIVAWAKNPKTKETVTLELQQDREAATGNRWGAWFRNDLELFPGPDFYWNGAMHTAGNFFLTSNGGTGSGGNKSILHLVSSPKSCIYSSPASQISANMFTVANLANNNNIPFVGQLMVGTTKLNTAAGSVEIDLYKDEGPDISTDRIVIDPSNDSVANAFSPIDISLDPSNLFTLDISNPRGYMPTSQNSAVRDASWGNNALVSSRRFMNQFAVQPYVDDTYRADNRWGPKPVYADPESGNSYSMQQAGRVNGEGITNIADLTRNDATNPDQTNFGLDGYWERRATRQGVRLIVGQRLELGNTFGWQGANSPLYPPLPGAAGNTNTNMNGRRHELRQWKAYHDNLAAAQATAIYHYQSDNGEYPVACMATTAHPGTGQTITNSTTFTNLPYSGSLNVDFLTGNGTNGMEFAPLARATFEAAVGDANSNLRKAIANLAYFAGDPQGAFPAVQEAVGGLVHPFPTLTMWGDYSNLRRIIQDLNSGIAYANLSLADRTTLQTASCTLGMLAYSLRTAENEFNSAVAGGPSQLVSLGGKLQELVDNVESNGNPELGWDNTAGRVVLCFNTEEAYFNGSTPQLRTRIATNCPGNYVNAGGTNTYQPARPSGGYQPQDWQNALTLWLGTKSGGNVPTLADTNALQSYVNSLGRMAQVRRDRERGFASGRASLTTDISDGNYTGNYNSNTGQFTTSRSHGSGLPAGTVYGGLSCDPNIFQLNPEQPEMGLSLAVCGGANNAQPKYPALYYLFPLATHGHSGLQDPAVKTAANTIGYGREVPQPREDLNNNGALDLGEDSNGNGVLDHEDYVANINVFNPTLVNGINCKPTTPAAVNCQTDVYRAINDANNDGVDDDPLASYANLLISPRTGTGVV